MLIVQILRYDSAFRANKVSSPACRGSKRPAPHQDVAEGADRGTGRGRNPAHEWRQFIENSAFCASNACPERPVVCLAVKLVGKPDAGNRLVRFDERGWETGRWP